MKRCSWLVFFLAFTVMTVAAQTVPSQADLNLFGRALTNLLLSVKSGDSLKLFGWDLAVKSSGEAEIFVPFKAVVQGKDIDLKPVDDASPMLREGRPARDARQRLR